MTATGAPLEGLLGDLDRAARRLGLVTLLGWGWGIVVVGVLGRLAMMLLARLNPQVAGVTSDDGFVIGQFTVDGSLNLLVLAGTFFGVLGAGCYVALRGLMIGPPWFRLASISGGPAVVVGALLVHTDGVDFRLLEPLWLAVGLFIALPLVYVAGLHLLVERSPSAKGAVPTWALLGVAPWALLFPAGLALLAGFLGLWWVRSTDRGGGLLGSRWPGRLARAGLVVVFVLAVVDLVRDVVALTGATGP